jgi:hypothetical protein
MRQHAHFFLRQHALRSIPQLETAPTKLIDKVSLTPIVHALMRSPPPQVLRMASSVVSLDDGDCAELASNTMIFCEKGNLNVVFMGNTDTEHDQPDMPMEIKITHGHLWFPRMMKNHKTGKDEPDPHGVVLESHSAGTQFCSMLHEDFNRILSCFPVVRLRSRTLFVVQTTH